MHPLFLVLVQLQAIYHLPRCVYSCNLHLIFVGRPHDGPTVIRHRKTGHPSDRPEKGCDVQ